MSKAKRAKNADVKETTEYRMSKVERQALTAIDQLVEMYPKVEVSLKKVSERVHRLVIRGERAIERAAAREAKAQASIARKSDRAAKIEARMEALQAKLAKLQGA